MRTVELADAVRRRRMMRSFSAEPVAAEKLDRVLELACTAPSAGNTDGWDAVVMTGDQTAPFWDATTTPTWRVRSRRWAGLSRAPVVVAVFVDPEAYVRRYAEADKEASGLGESPGAWTVPYWYMDGGFALLLILLAASDAGLGACLLGNFRGEGELCATLGVPPGRRYVGAVVMGIADGGDPPSTSVARGRRTVDAAIHRGRW